MEKTYEIIFKDKILADDPKSAVREILNALRNGEEASFEVIDSEGEYVTTINSYELED